MVKLRLAKCAALILGLGLTAHIFFAVRQQSVPHRTVLTSYNTQRLNSPKRLVPSFSVDARKFSDAERAHVNELLEKQEGKVPQSRLYRGSVLIQPMDEDQIEISATSLYLVIDEWRYSYGKQKILVLTGERGDGISQKSIHVYVKIDNSDAWTLILTRYTNTSDVKVYAVDNPPQLEFRSKGDKVLMLLPMEGLTYGYDPAEDPPH